MHPCGSNNIALDILSTGLNQAGDNGDSIHLLQRTRDLEPAPINVNAMPPDLPVVELGALDGNAPLGFQGVGTWRRHGRNLGIIVGRNTLSVFMPTLAREAVRRYALAPMTGWHPAAATVIGTVALLAPVAAHAVGSVRDYRNGTSNRVTVGCRITHIVLILVAGVLLIFFGGIVSAAPALAAANLCYTPLRDAAQYGLVLRDNTNAAGSRAMWATGIAGGAYGVNQAVVGIAMDGAANLLESFGMSSRGANLLSRPFVNVLGETVDEYVSRQLRVVFGDRRPLEVTWALRPMHASTDEPGFEHNRQAVLDQILSSNAGRSSLFSAAISAGVAAEQMGGGSYIGNVGAGIAFAAGYVPFTYVHHQTPRPSVHSSQSDLEVVPLPTDSNDRTPGPSARSSQSGLEGVPSPTGSNYHTPRSSAHSSQSGLGAISSSPGSNYHTPRLSARSSQSDLGAVPPPTDSTPVNSRPPSVS